MALPRRSFKPNQYRRRRRYYKKGGKKPTMNINKRLLALEKQARVTRHNEVTFYTGYRLFAQPPNQTISFGGFGGINHAIFCLNVPNFNPLCFNSVVYKSYEKVYQHTMNLSLFFKHHEFLTTETPKTAGITYFIVKAKKELQASNSSTVLDSLTWNRHYIQGGQSNVTGSNTEQHDPTGRDSSVFLNRSLFQIIAYKRFFLGKSAGKEDQPLTDLNAIVDTSINTSYRRYYHKINIKQMLQNSFTSASTQGGALEMTEAQMPITSRYYLICFTDQSNEGTTPKYPYLSLSIQGQMKVSISN